MGDSPDLAAAKQLMHGAKAEGFRFERIAEGPDAPVVGVRDSVGYRDEIYLAGFSDSCTAIRHKRFSLIVPSRPPVVSHRPDSTLMTTAAAAHHLGLAGRDSARIWLAQRGIRPVGREPGPSGQNLYPAEAVMPLKSRGRSRRPTYDPWRDAAGVSISPDARVEQVLVDRAQGALASRLGKHAQVIRHSRGNRLVVRFDDEDHPVSIRPDLVRLRPVSREQIIGQLEQLRDLARDGDGR